MKEDKLSKGEMKQLDKKRLMEVIEEKLESLRDDLHLISVILIDMEMMELSNHIVGMIGTIQYTFKLTDQLWNLIDSKDT